VFYATSVTALKKDTEVSFFNQQLEVLGWLMGLEPTTAGITILSSTN
jgi:hypothetical protein